MKVQVSYINVHRLPVTHYGRRLPDQSLRLFMGCWRDEQSIVPLQPPDFNMGAAWRSSPLLGLLLLLTVPQPYSLNPVRFNGFADLRLTALLSSRCMLPPRATVGTEGAMVHLLNLLHANPTVF